VDLEVVATQVAVAGRALARIKALKSFQALEDLRNMAVAHHTPAPDEHSATMGPLDRLMIRSVHLVDHIAVAVQGEPTATLLWLRELRAQATAFWSAGMDAYVADFRDKRSKDLWPDDDDPESWKDWADVR
jgi:hypothetical protein